jgi:hypothetical protein
MSTPWQHEFNTWRRRIEKKRRDRDRRRLNLIPRPVAYGATLIAGAIAASFLGYPLFGLIFFVAGVVALIQGRKK